MLGFQDKHEPSQFRACLVIMYFIKVEEFFFFFFHRHIGRLRPHQDFPLVFVCWLFESPPGVAALAVRRFPPVFLRANRDFIVFTLCFVFPLCLDAECSFAQLLMGAEL